MENEQVCNDINRSVPESDEIENVHPEDGENIGAASGEQGNSYFRLGEAIRRVRRRLFQDDGLVRQCPVPKQRQRLISLQCDESIPDEAELSQRVPVRFRKQPDGDCMDQDGFFAGGMDVFEEVFQRYTQRICDEMYRYIKKGNNGVRRLLHDSVKFTNQSEFDSLYNKLCQSLYSIDGWIIAVHDEGSTKHYRNRLSGWQTKEQPWSVLESPYIKEEIIDEFGNFYRVTQDEVTWNIGTMEEEVENIPKPHWGHFHVIHGCDWYNSECRHFKRSIDVAPRYRKIRRLESISKEHVFNILKYIQTNDKWLLHYKDPSGQERRYVLRAQCLPSNGVCEGEASGSMEESLTENEMVGEGRIEERPDDNEDLERGDGGNSKSSRARDYTTQKLLNYLQNLVCYPIDHVFQTPDWYKSPYKFYLPSDKIVKRCTNILGKIIMNWEYQDFVRHYEHLETKCIWGAPSLDTVNNYYMSYEKSCDVIEELLDYQLKNNLSTTELTEIEKKQQFCQDLYDILEKKIPKKNSFQIISPPSAGKNFFFDSIFAFYWNIGLIRNFNKYENFPLMEAVDKRVNCWNEPNFEPAAEDTIKMILGGDPIKTPVKYEHERNIMRTPVIIMTNKNVFKQNEAFEDRIITYTWERAEFLKEYRKKIHPMTWTYLVNNYVLNL